jgi:cytochrome c
MCSALRLTTGNFTAHVNKASLGTDIRALGEKVYSATQAGTILAVSQEFPKPGTTDPVPKESHVTRVGNQAWGVGYYK